MIQAQSLTRSFGGSPVVEDVTLDVRPGEVVGFLGPNGAGKTTTIRMILGLLRPTSGEATLTRPVGYLPESFTGDDGLAVARYLRYCCAVRGIDTGQVGPVLERVGLSEWSRRPIRRLSKGQRQRVGLAQALLGSPKTLVLDEPTTGLDPAQVVDARKIQREAAEDGAAVLVSTHRLAEAASACDRIVVLVGGRVVAEEAPAGVEELEERFLKLVGAAELGALSSETPTDRDP